MKRLKALPKRDHTARVAVESFFAWNPDRWFTLWQISVSTTFAIGTIYAVFATMRREGWQITSRYNWKTRQREYHLDEWI